MGLKVDREAVATLVLPQLWALSMGPCRRLFSSVMHMCSLWPLVLNVSQFQHFMSVIHKLSERVEREHLQHLRDSHRLEDKSALTPGSNLNGNTSSAGGVDFENLVASANNAAVKPDVVFENGKDWQDDVWGSLLNSEVCLSLYVPRNMY